MEGSGLQKEILFLLFLPLLLIILLQLLGNAYRHLAVLPDFMVNSPLPWVRERRTVE